MRYLYVKNGDVVTQLERVLPIRGDIPTSGPDAFIADFLRSTGDEPALLISFCDQAKTFEMGSKMGRVFFCGGRKTCRAGRVVMKVLALCRALVVISKFRPERILCGTHGWSLWMSFFLSRWYSIPLVHSCHNSLLSFKRSLYRRLFAALDLWCIRHGKAVICHGPYIKQQCLALGVPGDRVIEFDIGFEDMLKDLPLSDGRDRANQPEGAKLVAFVGRIEREKGVYDLLDACIPMLHRDPEVKVVFVGGGAELDNLRDRIRRLEIADQVRSTGEVDHSGVGKAVRMARVVVTPTRSSFPEARCMAAMESMFLGIPVIAPDRGPFPYLVRHGENGLLFEPDSVQSLRSAVEAAVYNDTFYSRLCAGAVQTGRKMLNPSLTFSQAVERGFAEQAAKAGQNR